MKKLIFALTLTVATNAFAGGSLIGSGQGVSAMGGIGGGQGQGYGDLVRNGGVTGAGPGSGFVVDPVVINSTSGTSTDSY